MWDAVAPAGVALLFALGAISIVVACWYDFRVRRRLEQAHPGITRRFGESRGPTGRMLTRFIWRDEHQSLGDPLLSRFVERTRLGCISVIVCFAAGWAGLQLLR